MFDLLSRQTNLGFQSFVIMGVNETNKLTTDLIIKEKCEKNFLEYSPGANQENFFRNTVYGRL
jgi:hypothetical protein